MKLYPPHPLAELLPEMSEAEYAALLGSVYAEGLLEPITLYEGKILDGRHRQRACAETGVEPRYEEFLGHDPRAFVIARNLARRQLNTSEKAKIGAKLARHPVGQPAWLGTYTQGEVPLTSAQVAAWLGISRHPIDLARRLEDEAPDLFEQLDGRGRGRTAGALYRVLRARRRAARTPEAPDASAPPPPTSLVPSLEERRAERALRDEQAWHKVIRANGAVLTAWQDRAEILGAIERALDLHPVSVLAQNTRRASLILGAIADAATERLPMATRERIAAWLHDTGFEEAAP